MSVALLITAISFFLGQAPVFPAAIQDSWVLVVPEIGVLATLAFWMFRLLWSKSIGGVELGRGPAPGVRPP